MNQTSPTFDGTPSRDRVERALQALRAGRGVLVTDNENRENEGDLIFAAESLTTSQMAMLIRECSGIVCLCLPDEKVRALDLPPMVGNNSSRYQTAFTVVAAYVILFLPRTLVPIRAGLAQIPPGWEEAARSLGASPARARMRITLPLLVPAMASGAALVAIGAANELTATLLLAPTGTATVATAFWSAASNVEYIAAAPFALALVILSVPAVHLMFSEATSRRSA